MVVKVPVGRKMVALTAYCPDDILGLAACDYLLARVIKELADTTEEELRAWLIKFDPGWIEVFAMMDEGFTLPKDHAEFPVSPGNIRQELRIINHLKREQLEQRASA